MANLNLNFRTKYGLDWPVGVVDPFIELNIAKKWREEPYCFGNIDDPVEHMFRAIHELFPRGFLLRNRWSELMVDAWCKSTFISAIGAASSGKSFTFGVLALLDFVTDPSNTYIAMASTSLGMLKVRTFSGAMEAFNHLKRHPKFTVPLKESASQVAILNDVDSGASDSSLKFALRGVAVGDGNDSKAVARLAGVHGSDYITMILDEGSALPPAAAKARVNASAGTKHFRFVSLANPIDRYDEATKFCEPVEGWSSVDVNTETWQSNYGVVLHFNAMNSPALTEPDGEKKYPFLLSRERIATIIREAGGNTQDRLVYTMVYGFPPSAGSEMAVLTDADIDNFRLKDDVVFDGRGTPVVRVAALDAAFTVGGDSSAWRWAEAGYSKEGAFVLQLREVTLLPMDPESKIPIAYQVAQGAIAKCKEHNIPIENMVIDDSGTQSIAAIVQHESGRSPIACNFAARPAFDTENRYRNMVTELWHAIQALARNHQLRGLDAKTAHQFCSRRFKNAIKPIALESKAEYKSRLGGSGGVSRSPDEADATAMLTLAARRICGLVPGSNRPGTLENGFAPEYANPPETSYDFSVDTALGSGYSDIIY